MTITEIINFCGIAVSIIFGFFISHINAIRDTRTRVIKDHYIEQIKSIKGRVDSFFHKLIFEKSSFRKVIIWYNHIDLDISSIDDGVRKCLDLQIEKFSALFSKYYDEITGWSDFNDQYVNARYIPTVESKIKLRKMKYEIDEFLNDYIRQVNQANSYNVITEQLNQIKESRSFYKSNSKSYPLLRAIWHLTKNHILEFISILAIVIIFVILCFNVKETKEQNLEKTLNSISSKLDTISNSINQFKEKYEPVEIKTKTFHNSAFFNADNVDSVQVKLYQVK